MAKTFAKYFALLKGDKTVLVTFTIGDRSFTEADAEAVVRSIELTPEPTLEERLAELPFTFRAVEPYRVEEVIPRQAVTLEVEATKAIRRPARHRDRLRPVASPDGRRGARRRRAAHAHGRLPRGRDHRAGPARVRGRRRATSSRRSSRTAPSFSTCASSPAAAICDSWRAARRAPCRAPRPSSPRSRAPSSPVARRAGLESSSDCRHDARSQPRCIVLAMRTPGLLDRARPAPRARLWSWLGVGALVAVVGVAVVYGVTVEPSLLPRAGGAFGQPPYRSDLDARTAIEAGQGARGRERQDAHGHVRRELVPGLRHVAPTTCTRPRRARTPRSTSRSSRSTSATRRRAPPCSAISASPSTSFRSRCSTRRRASSSATRSRASSSRRATSRRARSVTSSAKSWTITASSVPTSVSDPRAATGRARSHVRHRFSHGLARAARGRCRGALRAHGRQSRVLAPLVAVGRSRDVRGRLALVPRDGDGAARGRPRSHVRHRAATARWPASSATCRSIASIASARSAIGSPPRCAGPRRDDAMLPLRRALRLSDARLEPHPDRGRHRESREPRDPGAARLQVRRHPARAARISTARSSTTRCTRCCAASSTRRTSDARALARRGAVCQSSPLCQRPRRLGGA